jgi:uncharacterized repeat protein (TIGR04076 family)
MEGGNMKAPSRRRFIEASVSVIGVGIVAGLTGAAYAAADPNNERREEHEEKRNMSELKIPKVTITVVSQKGTCAFGHTVGQKFEVGMGTPAGLCAGAYCSAAQSIFALQVDGQIPWAKPDGSVHIACPDPDNPLVMEIKRER